MEPTVTAEHAPHLDSTMDPAISATPNTVMATTQGSCRSLCLASSLPTFFGIDAFVLPTFTVLLMKVSCSRLGRAVKGSVQRGTQGRRGMASTVTICLIPK